MLSRVGPDRESRGTIGPVHWGAPSCPRPVWSNPVWVCERSSALGRTAALAGRRPGSGAGRYPVRERPVTAELSDSVRQKTWRRNGRKPRIAGGGARPGRFLGPCSRRSICRPDSCSGQPGQEGTRGFGGCSRLSRAENVFYQPVEPIEQLCVGFVANERFDLPSELPGIDSGQTLA